jgi:hypothetical protein
MSKERELLEKVLYISGDAFDFLRDDIRELLAQPDQDIVSIAADAIINDLKELFAKPDDHIKSLLEEICSLRDQNALLKKKAELPKREPSITAREMYQRGYADGVRFAEKTHGITGETK